MSAQLSIFETITLPVADSRDVRIRGAADEAVPRHDWAAAPGRPEWLTEEQWGDLLAQAEKAIRWKSAPRSTPNLDENPRELTGSGGAWWYDAKGFREWGDPRRPQSPRYVSWAAIRRALREIRERDPAVARARDLAEALHLLDYYQRAYLGHDGSSGWVPLGDRWSPDPLLDRLRSDIVLNGGAVPSDLLVRARDAVAA